MIQPTLISNIIKIKNIKRWGRDLNPYIFAFFLSAGERIAALPPHHQITITSLGKETYKFELLPYKIGKCIIDRTI